MANKLVHDAFEEGREARFSGKGLEANPYPGMSEKHEAWTEGWRNADAPDSDEKNSSES